MMTPDPVAAGASAASVLTKATRRAAQGIGLTHADLAAILGTSEASVSRIHHGREIDPESREGELAALFLRLVRSLDAIVGGDDAKARAWLEAWNDHLGGMPRERVKTIEGLVDVVHYLDAMRGKL